LVGYVGHEALTSKHVSATFPFALLTPNIVCWIVGSVCELIVDGCCEVLASISDFMVNTAQESDQHVSRFLAHDLIVDTPFFNPSRSHDDVVVSHKLRTSS
jgi:hypothetical protein